MLNFLEESGLLARAIDNIVERANDRQLKGSPYKVIIATEYSLMYMQHIVHFSFHWPQMVLNWKWAFEDDIVQRGYKI